MKPLTDAQLWSKVRSLLGEEVLTNVKRNTNTVTEVLHDKIVLLNKYGRPRPSPSRSDFWDTYQHLLRERQVTGGDFEEGGALAHVRRRRVAAIVVAMLRDAVPDQIEPLHGRLGIRLRTNAVTTTVGAATSTERIDRLEKGEKMKKAWNGNITIKLDQKEDTQNSVGSVEVEKYGEDAYRLDIVGGEGRCRVTMRMTREDCKAMIAKFANAL
jgi:hypothetical protein